MSKRTSRRADRKRENAIKVLVLGIGLILVPVFLSGSQIGVGLKNLPFIGVIAMVVGGVMLWLDRVDKSGAAGRSDASAKVVSLQRARTVRPSVAHSPSDEIPTRPREWCPNVLDLIEWRRLEAVVEALFKQAGFDTKAQSHGADGGVDIWLFSKNKPGEAASVVQCKHWTSKVGVDKVREFKGVMASHRIERGQFVGTSGFTPDAEAFASANGINLLDKNKLLGLIARRRPEEQTVLLDIALEGEYWKPTCASCGVKMTQRKSQRSGGEFWGCVKYPVCKNKL